MVVSLCLHLVIVVDGCFSSPTPCYRCWWLFIFAYTLLSLLVVVSLCLHLVTVVGGCFSISTSLLTCVFPESAHKRVAGVLQQGDDVVVQRVHVFRQPLVRVVVDLKPSRISTFQLVPPKNKKTQHGFCPPLGKRVKKGKGALFILGKYYQHSWWGRVGGMVRKRTGSEGKTVGVASPDENLPTSAGRGNRTHDLLVRCFIADSGPPPQTARPPNQ